MKTIKIMKRSSIVAALLMTAVMLSPAQEAPMGVNDGAHTVSKRVDNMHQTRFIELFFARHDAKGALVANCYNTMFSYKGIPQSKDTAPQKLVEGLDFDKMKELYGVLGVSLNGPKLWLPDWTDIDTGVQREFNGIITAWVALLNMGDNTGGVSKTVPYKPVTIVRKSSLGWNKGTKVLLLDDAEGNTWIMKGFELGIKPKYDYDEFLSKGASMFKKLPAGWKVRIVELEKDLIETPENGVAYIMADEHFNVYDRTGPGMMNYQP